MITDFQVHWLDVSANLLTGKLPVYLIERPLIHDQPKAWSGTTEVARDGTFYVPQLAAFSADPLWAKTSHGQWVRIPVHAYRTTARSLAAIWGLGLQVGMDLLESFRSHNHEAVQSVVLVLGNDCTDLLMEGHESFRAYVGVAIVVR